MPGPVLLLSLLKLALRLDVGPEFDSNVHHVENPRPGSDDAPLVASLLLRARAGGRLAWSRGPTTLRLSLDLGGKLFAEAAAQAQDVAVGRLSGELRQQLSRGSLALALDYHESWQGRSCPPALTRDERGVQTFAVDSWCHRDFRIAELRASGTVRTRVPSLTGEAWVRDWEWKPDESLTFLGVGAALTPAALWRLGSEREHEWRLSTTGRLEWRQGRARLDEPSELALAAGPRRHDVVASLALAGSYLGRALVAASWLIEADRSTLAGGSYVYHSVTAQAAVPLPASFSLGLRAQLLFFLRGALPSSLTGEDENRDSFVVDLARDFAHGLSLRARYQLFISPPGSAQIVPGSTGSLYERHVGSLTLTWQSR